MVYIDYFRGWGGNALHSNSRFVHWLVSVHSGSTDFMAVIYRRCLTAQLRAWGRVLIGRDGSTHRKAFVRKGGHTTKIVGVAKAPTGADVLLAIQRATGRT